MSRIIAKPGPFVSLLLMLFVVGTVVAAAMSSYSLAVSLGLGVLLIVGALVAAARKLEAADSGS